LEIGKSAVKSGKQRINNLWPDRFVDEKKIEEASKEYTTIMLMFGNYDHGKGTV